MVSQYNNKGSGVEGFNCIVHHSICTCMYMYFMLQHFEKFHEAGRFYQRAIDLQVNVSYMYMYSTLYFPPCTITCMIVFLSEERLSVTNTGKTCHMQTQTQ